MDYREVLITITDMFALENNNQEQEIKFPYYFNCINYYFINYNLQVFQILKYSSFNYYLFHQMDQNYYKIIINLAYIINLYHLKFYFIYLNIDFIVLP